MPKPILVVYYPLVENFEDYERLVVKMQEQCSDYHVIGVPRQDGEMELKVMSADYVSEYDILETKEIITNEIKRYYGNKNVAREV